MTHVVRATRWEEAETVAALFNAINSLDGPLLVPMTAEAVRRDLLGPEPWATLLVAELDGEVVGFVTGSPCYDSERAAGGFFLVDLYVRPEARRLLAAQSGCPRTGSGSRFGAGFLPRPVKRRQTCWIGS